MKRINIEVRNQWQGRVEKLGFGFHTTNIPYWDESVCYEFSLKEIEAIEYNTNILWEMCLDAVQYVIDQKLYKLLRVPEFLIEVIEKSWNEDHPSIYSRFDLCYNNGKMKLLEINADTPTSLFEMAVIQWFWLKDFSPGLDQFNSVHEKLIQGWAYLKPYLYDAPLHFSCVKRSLEDLTTTEYLRDCAIQAGFDTSLLFIDDLGWNGNSFVDIEENTIKNIFKLYPWEFMVSEQFGRKIIEDQEKAFWIEPPWKLLLSNKAILPVLYHLYKGNDLILPAFFEEPSSGNYVKKPIFGREGSNITIIENGNVLEKTNGDYGEEGFIYQEYCELPNFNKNYPLIGSWIIGQEAAGIGIREAGSLITNNTSRFVPHYISK